jgi:hypothetical protein
MLQIHKSIPYKTSLEAACVSPNPMRAAAANFILLRVAAYSTAFVELTDPLDINFCKNSACRIPKCEVASIDAASLRYYQHFNTAVLNTHLVNWWSQHPCIQIASSRLAPYLFCDLRLLSLLFECASVAVNQDPVFIGHFVCQWDTCWMFCLYKRPHVQYFLESRLSL